MSATRFAALLPLLASVVASAPAGCTPRASPDDCRRACEHIAPLQAAEQLKSTLIKVHEMDEAVDQAEDAAKVEVPRLKKELAEGDPQWDEKAVRARHLSPEALRAVLEKHQWEEQRLRKEREAAIQRSEDFLASARKRYQDAKAQADKDLAKAKADALASCSASCPKRPRPEVDCLLRAESASDVALCAPK